MAGEEGNLIQQVKTGLRWSLFNTLVGRAATFVSGIVLARILAPHDYGIFAVALVVMQLLLSLNDVGVSTAIVRWKGDLEEIVPTGTTLIIAVSLVLYLAMFLAAPAFTRALHAPGATGVVRLMSLGVVSDAIFAVPSVLLTRSLRQDRRAAADFIVFAVSTTVTIALALMGYGAWSLAWGRLIGNLAGGLAILISTRARIRPGYDRKAARHLLAFGLPLTGSSLLLFAMLNIDNVVVGRVLGPAALGLYVLAFNLSSWPVNILCDTVRRVSLVAFSRLQDDKTAVRTSLVRSIVPLAAITIPVCGLLAVLAHPLIVFVYGSKWRGAAGALEFLAVLGGCRVFVELISDYLIALGRPRTILAIQALWVAALIPALAVGAHVHGITGVAFAHMIIAGGLVMPAFLFALHRTGVRLAGLMRRTLRPVLGAVVALGAGVTLLGHLSGDLNELTACGMLVVAIYVLIVYPGRMALVAPLDPASAD